MTIRYTCKRFAVLLSLVLCTIIAYPQGSWSQELSGVGTFSSPRISDLNQDGIGDIILGTGREEFVACDTAVFALDGATGNMLWKVSARDQMFASAGLKDITGDGIVDIVIGGRSAELKAIDGSNGQVLWEFYEAKEGEIAADAGWFNFYNPQFIPDQDGDGIEDILVSNGGDVRVEPYDPARPAGNLLVINSLTGKLLAKAQMPDGNEIYMSVIAKLMVGEYDLCVIFGTGGETLGGNLYATKLSDIMKEDLSKAYLLASSPDKGFIAPGVWADINLDGIHDIVVSAVDGRILAFDGKTFEPLWSVTMPGTEIYSSLAVGYFTGDEAPDFFTSVAKGKWPKLEWNRQYMIDGGKGEIAFADSLGFYQTSSAVAADLTQNGREEVLLSVNYQVFDTLQRKSFKNMLVAIDFGSNKVIELGAYFEGNNISSTPWMGDLDGNGKLDIVYCHSTNRYQTYTFDGMKVHRISTDIPLPSPIKWGGYMGSRGNGIFPLKK